MTEIHLSHVMPSFLCENRTRSNRSKFLAREKSRTRMHDKRYKFLVRVSRARNLDQELGSCVMGLSIFCVFMLNVRNQVVHIYDEKRGLVRVNTDLKNQVTAGTLF